MRNQRRVQIIAETSRLAYKRRKNGGKKETRSEESKKEIPVLKTLRLVFGEWLFAVGCTNYLKFH